MAILTWLSVHQDIIASDLYRAQTNPLLTLDNVVARTYA